MADAGAAILGWAVPALVVFGVAAVAAIAGVWMLRRARRSPRARAAAEAERAAAGSALVALDDAIEEIDLEVGLSGALYGGEAPASLRRARMTAQHARDQSFDDYRTISTGEALLPDEITRTARRVRARTDQALGVIARARQEHDDWVRRNVSAAEQVAAATRRLADLRAAMGDPDALVRELSARFAEEEWTDARAAAHAAMSDAAEAEALLAEAASSAADPTRTALPGLARAERAIRRAQAEARTLEERHRLITQAALAVPGELEVVRAAVRQAETTRGALEPADADRLATAIREADAAIDALQSDAEQHPTVTIAAIARIRDRLDMALGDARTAQQRLRGARTALPGTLAAARNAVAQAETAVAAASTGADARVRLGAAQAELAGARQAQDPVEALDAARRAMRHAEDALALAAYDRRG
jgi:DNA repair exonuclease SbcCD ATPase subunit